MTNGIVGGITTATLSSYLRNSEMRAKFRFKNDVILYLKRTRSPKKYYDELRCNLTKYWLKYKAKGKYVDFKEIKHLLWENTKGMK